MSVRDNIEEPSPIGRSLWIAPDGEAVMRLSGDLDVVSAEAAFGYVSDVIDRCRGPVFVELSEINFCDTHGLQALARLCRYAEWSGRRFYLASPSDQLIKVIQAAGPDLKLPVS